MKFNFRLIKNPVVKIKLGDRIFFKYDVRQKKKELKQA